MADSLTDGSKMWRQNITYLDPEAVVTKDSEGTTLLIDLDSKIIIQADGFIWVPEGIDRSEGHHYDCNEYEEMLVDMEVKVRTMRTLVYQTAWGLDRGVADRLDVALMKRYVPRTATEVASDAIQVLGGRGYTENSRVSGIWQDCRGMQIAEGTDEIMVHIAAPLLLERSAR